MARLAAYYQEDFQYPPIGYGPKQRKSTCVYYEEPRNNLFNNYMSNGERFRNLATSEPALSPLPHNCKTEKMSLKHKPMVYGSQLIESSYPAIQYFDNDHNVHYTSNRFARLQNDLYDNEIIYPDDRSIYDDGFIPRHRNKLKDKAHKRFSYAEPQNNSDIPEVYVSQNYDGYHSQVPVESDVNISHNRYEHPSGDYYINASQRNRSSQSPAYYQNHSTEGNWHQWPDEILSNRNLLSPPSPLDSGLSSQSITSSPSLEADSFPSQTEFVSVVKTERDRLCLCPKLMYSDFRNQAANLSRHDSGRSSGIYSSYGYPKESVRLKSGVINNDVQIPHCRDGFEYNGHQTNQIRYGKLGLLGEPTNNGASVNNIPKKKHEHPHKHHGNVTLERLYETCYEGNDSIGSFKRTPLRISHNHHSKYEKQYPLAAETVEKIFENQGPLSSELDNSDKSNGINSPVSPTISNSTSKSSSVSSSNAELNCSDRRNPNRTTEKEIRELEDMYEKCNLGDVDLLDRAERRDLPTVHQSNPRLKRSKSDTLYETISPMFRNPYEIPQRAPPLRRSGLPDRVADDMALRKLHKSAKTSASTANRNTITYMLCSSHFTPTVPASKDVLLLDYPDVEFDDLSYRKHYFGKKSKIADPQPPFGIPLRPPPPQKVFTDYLHAIPSDAPQPICHPRGNPDIVRDDLAFRALRKDEPERLYYDISQLYKMRKK